MEEGRSIETHVLQLSADHPDRGVIDRAAELLQRGELVAFPTETVYGLGANALDAEAVAGIFRAKGRPANNPLIVHVLDVAGAVQLITEWPESASALADRFWPGPLTLVLPKASSIPDAVTCGGSTVAIRVPAHPVARALLHRTGFPLAAPSANLSEHLSPTTAEHVIRDLNGRIAMILDSGPTSGGIESTVISLAGPVPTLLRPGLITSAEIETVIGPISRERLQSETSQESPAQSPGMMARHYAPRAQLRVASNAVELALEMAAMGEFVGLLVWSVREIAAATNLYYSIGDTAIVTVMPSTPKEYAAELYAKLHELDDLGVNRIVVEELPDSEEWMAIRDRLGRAAQTK